MIARIQHKKPRISFGLGRTQITAKTGEVLKVYQHAIYLDSLYVVNLDLDEIATEKVNNYEFNITPTTTGTYELRVNVSSTDKKISVDSNKIILIVE